VGTIRALTKGAGALRPFVNAVRGVDKAAKDGGAIVVLDGAPDATRRLREILGVGADEPLRDGRGLLVHAAVAGHDPTLAAAVMAGSKREGRRVLAFLIGTPDERAELERLILDAQPLEPSNVAHVATLDDPAPILATVARVLADDAVAAALRHPVLRETVADTLVARAARQAGATGVVAVIPGADLPAITLIQVRLVAQLAALHGRPLDVRRGLEIAGVLAGAIGWRALARRAVASVPVAGFAVRGGVAYSATRAVGEAARAYFAKAGNGADQPLDGLQQALKGVVSRRGRR
jgi:uncharacterized protein (DUF697 family)